jgi:hypothetical protein
MKYLLHSKGFIRMCTDFRNIHIIKNGVGTQLYFSMISGFKSTQKSHIHLNKIIASSKSLEQIEYIYKKHNKEFSVINWSTLLNVLTNDFNVHAFSVEKFPNIFLRIEEDLKNTENIILNSNYARAISNLLFYMTKIENQNINKFFECRELLVKYGIQLVDDMNDQEYANLIYSLTKFGKRNELEDMIPHIEQRSAKMSIDTLARLLYPLALLDLKSNIVCELLESSLKMNEKLSRMITPQDYSSIFYFIGKSDFQFKKSFFEALETNAKYLIGHQNCEGLVTILHSLSKRNQEFFTNNFYHLLEVRTLQELKNFDAKGFSLIFRGFITLGKGSSLFFDRLIEELFLRNQFDQDSLTAIAYHATRLSPFNFKKVMEHITTLILANNILAEFSPQNLELILFTYYTLARQGEGISSSMKTLLGRSILEKYQTFDLQQTISICSMVNILEKADAESFCLKVRKMIISDSQESTDIPFQKFVELISTLTSQVPNLLEDNKLLTKLMDYSLDVYTRSTNHPIEGNISLKVDILLVQITCACRGITNDFVSKRTKLLELLEERMITYFQNTKQGKFDSNTQDTLLQLISSFKNANYKLSDSGRGLFRTLYEKINSRKKQLDENAMEQLRIYLYEK